jgi:hypothetical protein
MASSSTLFCFTWNLWGRLILCWQLDLDMIAIIQQP